MKLITALLTVLLVGVTASVQAAAIPGLFNTGVDDSGALLAGGAIDPHYELVASPGDAFGPSAFAADPIPGGFWVPNSSSSRWIAPTVNQALGSATTPPGDYLYRLSFDLTGLDPSSAQISGKWATDNSGQIFINDTLTANLSLGFGALTTFAVTSGFVAGLNYLDFAVHNLECGGCSNPTGLRVEDIAGTANVAAIPEPETYALMLAGLGLLGFAARRRTRA